MNKYQIVGNMLELISNCKWHGRDGYVDGSTESKKPCIDQVMDMLSEASLEFSCWMSSRIEEGIRDCQQPESEEELLKEYNGFQENFGMIGPLVFAPKKEKN